MTIPISEANLAAFVEDCLERFDWQWMHIRPARVLRNGREIYETPYTGHKGWLDYLCMRPPRVVVIELKSESGKMTPEQQKWFNLWEQCQKTIFLNDLYIKGKQIKGELNDGTKVLTLPEVYTFRPADRDEILKVLR